MYARFDLNLLGFWGGKPPDWLPNTFSSGVYWVGPHNVWAALNTGVSEGQILALANEFDEMVRNSVRKRLKKWCAGHNFFSVIGQSASGYTMRKKSGLVIELPILDFPAFIAKETRRAKQIVYSPSILLPPVVNCGIKFSLKEPALLRGYQAKIISEARQSGVIVLPCGTGKTFIGLGIMAERGGRWLIVTNSKTSVSQWKAAAQKFLTIDPLNVREYIGKEKTTGDITITTYNTVVWSPPGQRGFRPNLKRLQESNPGGVIYDECHLMPASTFRMVAAFPCFKIGLTATPCRQDGKIRELTNLIGPSNYSGGTWSDFESSGWLAPTKLTEISVYTRLPEVANPMERFKNASCINSKIPVLEKLLLKHRDCQIIICGEFIDFLKLVAESINAPLVFGDTPPDVRNRLFELFRKKVISTLVLSRIGSTAIDLPCADVEIQINGLWGSQSEETQRIGRITRPMKDKQSYFYSIVSVLEERKHSRRRQGFMKQHGYVYEKVYVHRP